ncbi:MAG: hypothetical protein J2P17_14665 [Mycobacterium sp.]|nr:hypothetical protein [Mycobacterium sp.]
MASRRPARWPSFTALAIALIALAVSLVGWFRPAAHNGQTSAPPKPAYTNQQTGDAKASVCAAYQNVHQAVRLNFARDRGTDPATQLASAVNARQALVAGSQYLLTTLAEEPATPPDLAKAVRALANIFQKLTVDYLAEVSESEVDALRRASDETTLTIEGICK